MSTVVLLAGFGAAVTLTGVIGLLYSLRRTPVPVAGRPRRRPTWPRLLPRRTVILLVIGLGAGIVVAAVSGWLIAIVVGPAAAVGLPMLLSGADAKRRIARLEAMEEWIRSLSGVLEAGIGLDQVLTATLRSTPAAIRPEVTTLVNRLNANMPTKAALRAFADDLADPTGDIIAATLMMGSDHNGDGLASILDGLAESVSEEVRARRAIEADRAKPRQTGRLITVISSSMVLLLLVFSGDFVAPYRTPVGQLTLLLLLGAYIATLLWMRSMSIGKPATRFLGTDGSR